MIWSHFHHHSTNPQKKYVYIYDQENIHIAWLYFISFLLQPIYSDAQIRFSLTQRTHQPEEPNFTPATLCSQTRPSKLSHRIPPSDVGQTQRSHNYQSRKKERKKSRNCFQLLNVYVMEMETWETVWLNLSNNIQYGIGKNVDLEESITRLVGSRTCLLFSLVLFWILYY